ncbi:MAG: helix-turn-helix transcriptional regulator [Clostridia bacterium]|nr:helix-turn-helix transcriptional regulator [Clostridia bacterium]
MDYLSQDLTLFDPQLFFYFRNKYKPEIQNYLNEKHHHEIKNEISLDDKRNLMFIWNGILVKEIVHIGYTFEHLANHYNSFYEKIKLSKDLEGLQSLEISMFSKYIDIIIHQQEFTDHLLVNKILHYLYLHIEDDVSLIKLTKALNISQSYASRIFHEVMDTSIIKYSKYLKIERAKALLKTSESITNIGEKLGFYDQSHFSRTFKNLTGMSPQTYKTKEKNY